MFYKNMVFVFAFLTVASMAFGRSSVNPESGQARLSSVITKKVEKHKDDQGLKDLQKEAKSKSSHGISFKEKATCMAIGGAIVALPTLIGVLIVSKEFRESTWQFFAGWGAWFTRGK